MKIIIQCPTCYKIKQDDKYIKLKNINTKLPLVIYKTCKCCEKIGGIK